MKDINAQASQRLSGAVAYNYTKLQFHCKTGEYNDLATIFFTSRENSILQVIEAPHDYSFFSLLLLSSSFFGLMLLAYGIASPAGLFST